MSLDIQEVVKKWDIDQPKYLQLAEIVNEFFRKNITETEILPEVSYRTKEIISIIKKIKKKALKKDYSYENLNDKLGFRIICNFKDDLEKIDSFIKKYFKIKNVEYKEEGLDFDKLDYISNHYDLLIDTATFKKHEEFKELVFEVQVRTLNQHAWSNAAHGLSYKQETELPSSLKRRLYRLLSLYEIADQEFSLLNEYIKNQPDSKLHSLLSILERKIYKFAKIDYDRDLSKYTLQILITYFSEQEIEKIISNIERYIDNHSEKIKKIFIENYSRAHEMSFLSQPEIFFIWYALEHYSFSVENNWANDFDQSDLELIKNIWGINL